MSDVVNKYLFSLTVQDLKCDFFLDPKGTIEINIPERQTIVFWNVLLTYFKKTVVSSDEIVGYYYEKGYSSNIITKVLSCTKTDKLINIGCLELTHDEFEKLSKLIKYKYGKTEP